MSTPVVVWGRNPNTDSSNYSLDSTNFATDWSFSSVDSTLVYMMTAVNNDLSGNSATAFVPMKYDNGEKSPSWDVAFTEGSVTGEYPRGGHFMAITSGPKDKILSCINMFDSSYSINYALFFTGEFSKISGWTTSNIKPVLQTSASAHMCVGIDMDASNKLVMALEIVDGGGLVPAVATYDYSSFSTDLRVISNPNAIFSP